MRLTNDLRERLIRHRFEEPEGELEAREQRLADRLYNALYTNSERHRMMKLPNGWLKERLDIEVSMPGRGWVVLKFREPLRFQDQTGRCVLSLNTEDHSELIQDLHEYLEAKDMLSRTRQQARRDISAVLKSVHTDKRLLEVWPEVKPFLQEIVPLQPKSNLPAVPIQNLNTMLKLKKEAA